MVRATPLVLDRRTARHTAGVEDDLVAILGEQPWLAVPVKQGSVLRQVVVNAVATVLWLVVITQDDGLALGTKLLLSVAYFAAVGLFVERFVLTPRMLVLTERRLLTLHRRITGGIGPIVDERDRGTTEIRRPDRDRIDVISPGLPMLHLRVPYFFSSPGAAVADWASSPR